MLLPLLQDTPLDATMRTVDAVAEACPQALLDGGVADGLARIHQAEVEAAIKQVIPRRYPTVAAL